MAKSRVSTGAPFNVGDTVTLKSGGPTMTVVKVESPTYDPGWRVQTTWFAGKKNEHGWFPPAALVLEDEGQEKVRDVRE